MVTDLILLFSLDVCAFHIRMLLYLSSCVFTFSLLGLINGYAALLHSVIFGFMLLNSILNLNYFFVCFKHCDTTFRFILINESLSHTHSFMLLTRDQAKLRPVLS